MTEAATDGPTRVGVVGVGTMGQHHARVYGELSGAELVGVYDAAAERADEIAAERGTRAMELDELLAAVDAVSLAVPTDYHYDLARQCIERDVGVLVEKPFVKDLEEGRELIELAEERDVTVQVGHIERFNPAVDVLTDYLAERDLNVVAVDGDRLNPPLGADREIQDSAALDLMTHDIDILLSLVDAEASSVSGARTEDGNYSTATFQFEDGTIGRLTASRTTQERVRELTVTAEECLIRVDYADQSVEVHRHAPAEGQDEVIERLSVESVEPLKSELGSFVDAVETGDRPVVTAGDGLRVVELALRIDETGLPGATEGDR